MLSRIQREVSTSSNFRQTIIDMLLDRHLLQRDFDLETIDIHASGQEKWKKRYVYEIPVLHLQGKVIAKGRWNEETVKSSILQWTSASTNQGGSSSEPNVRP